MKSLETPGARRALLVLAFLAPLLLAIPAVALASDPAPAADPAGHPGASAAFSPPKLAGVQVEFLFFGATLLCVALFHHHTLKVALTGLATISAYKIFFSEFRLKDAEGIYHSHFGFAGWLHQADHEWVILTNLLGLLLGFGVLAHHFEHSKVPELLPRFLPSGWKGGFALLVLTFVLSTFLDNIAAAMIGGTVAMTVFRKKVHIGYLAAIVAASNAGGAGSVVGDTTTTMMWIDGVSPLVVIEAAIASVVALFIFGIPAAMIQDKHSPIQRDAEPGLRVDWVRIGIVAVTLVAAIATNVIVNMSFKEAADAFPFLGAIVCLTLLAAAAVRKPDWSLLPASLKGSLFLLALVMCASMMPVEELPEPSLVTALGLGFISAVFDNIPLTKLALDQGGYDWGFLAFAVGFGGSMTWFGSSAGVALTNIFPEAKSVGRWLRHGWWIAIAYVVSYFVQYFIIGWHPNAHH
jgi:Na+/H+ antiporter NhaD/arsenite permease-like protein